MLGNSTMKRDTKPQLARSLTAYCKQTRWLCVPMLFHKVDLKSGLQLSPRTKHSRWPFLCTNLASQNLAGSSHLNDLACGCISNKNNETAQASAQASTVSWAFISQCSRGLQGLSCMSTWFRATCYKWFCVLWRFRSDNIVCSSPLTRDTLLLPFLHLTSTSSTSSSVSSTSTSNSSSSFASSSYCSSFFLILLLFNYQTNTHKVTESSGLNVSVKDIWVISVVVVASILLYCDVATIWLRYGQLLNLYPTHMRLEAPADLGRSWAECLDKSSSLDI